MSYLAGVGESTLRLILTALTGVLVAGGLAIHLWRLLRRRLNYQQGLEGELATAEELNQLMLSGCRVFHDIPFPYGNIDHVVISPSGAFLVETKCIGRTRGRESETEVVVDHERNEIGFPNRTVAIPHQQLDRSVRWLSQKLHDSTGTPVRIEPMLALPGWFIRQRVGKGEAFVFNPKSPHKFFVHNRTVHSSERIQQLAHQLETLCRSVEPSRKSRKESSPSTA